MWTARSLLETHVLSLLRLSRLRVLPSLARVRLLTRWTVEPLQPLRLGTIPVGLVGAQQRRLEHWRVLVHRSELFERVRRLAIGVNVRLGVALGEVCDQHLGGRRIGEAERGARAPVGAVDVANAARASERGEERIERGLERDVGGTSGDAAQLDKGIVGASFGRSFGRWRPMTPACRIARPRRRLAVVGLALAPVGLRRAVVPVALSFTIAFAPITPFPVVILVLELLERPLISEVLSAQLIELTSA